MAWNGWFALGGEEIINASRTEAYARAAKLSWFNAVYNSELASALLQSYVNPSADPAPWYDPSVPESKDFFGAYPLDITGIEDSTRTATVTESTVDGGNPGRLRHATRSVVFSVVLVAATKAAADYGMAWLKNVLLSANCNGYIGCTGEPLTYYSADPSIEQDCAGIEFVNNVEAYSRTLFRCQVNTGPTINAKSEMLDGGQAWTVGFTLVAGTPFEFEYERTVITGMFGPNPDPSGGGTYDTVGHSFAEVDCSPAAVAPIYDASCGSLVLPPTVPVVPLTCYTTLANWWRYQFTIPEAMLDRWKDAAIRLLLTTTDTEVRNVRVRFFADQDGALDPDVTPCAFCGDILVTYLPVQASLLLDGTVNEATVTNTAGSHRAENLLLGTTGGPFTWPLLSCGTGYVVTVDVPAQDSPVPQLALSIRTRAS